MVFGRIFAFLTLNHVEDVAADGSDSGDLLLGSEPLLDEDLLAVKHTQIHSQVTEVTDELASGAADSHHSGANLARYPLGDLDRLVAVDLSHRSRFCKEIRKIFYY